MRRRRRRLRSWFAADKTVKHAVPEMQLDGQISTLKPPQVGDAPDPTEILSDEILLRVLAALPDSVRLSVSLVCRRWLRLAGRLRRSLTVLDWSFLHRRRLPLRFPNLDDLDLVPASFATPSDADAGVVLSKGAVSFSVDAGADPPVGECRFLEPDVIDRGLVIVASDCPGLRKLSLVALASEVGVRAVAEACDILQELELHRCSDLALRPISAFKNLQILRIVGAVEGFYSGPGVADIGLTMLAHGCKRLVKLELAGCEGSYDGISAVGQCCEMLEELTISNHRMDAGWIAALSFCENLKKLRLQSCRRIDADPGPLEHLGRCPSIQTLQMEQCQLRDKRSLEALFRVCEAVREVMFENCWGLDDDMFSLSSICRYVRSLSLEGCSLLTTKGFESVVLSWIDLKRLEVISCNNIKDDEVSPTLTNLFSTLKEFKWRPDSKSVLAMGLSGTDMGKKGGRFFK
ncbi:F-box protein At5g07670-like isoform X1 [Zingiber officinale]|uniref:F-box protein At5g07670-like isoform X1 n=1 Tax=Zingiber officinale TaxID=94328 RepID=UPI001C4DB287|nr:F-box protein At5g07670-like isoform X1 [Zingiber officinale]